MLEYKKSNSSKINNSKEQLIDEQRQNMQIRLSSKPGEIRIENYENIFNNQEINTTNNNSNIYRRKNKNTGTLIAHKDSKAGRKLHGPINILPFKYI